MPKIRHGGFGRRLSDFIQPRSSSGRALNRLPPLRARVIRLRLAYLSYSTGRKILPDAHHESRGPPAGCGACRRHRTRRARPIHRLPLSSWRSPERDTIRLAEEQGFQLINIRITPAAHLLSNDAGTWQDDGVREAAPADIPALHEIAGQGHTDSGFYRTAAFPPSCAMRCIAPGSRRVAQLCGRRFGGRTGLTADWVHLLPSEWRRQRPDSPHGGGQRDQEPGRCQTTRALCAL